MPNWVKNLVSFSGDPERIKELKTKLKTKENNFDFNQIIPAPQELFEIPAGGRESEAMQLAKLRKEHKDNWKSTRDFRMIAESKWMSNERTWDGWADLGDKYLRNLELYGSTTWYGWCISNWGTKWNACEVSWSGDDYVEFDTAWSFPEPIFTKLADLYPDILISVNFADEDIGNNCGHFEASENSVNTQYLDDFDFACDVRGLDPEEERAEREEGDE